MKKVIIGFTGTRNGMTDEQRESVVDLVQNLKHSLSTMASIVGLHGDCVGADADFHDICRAEELDVHQRPCTFKNMRARTDAMEIAKPMTAMVRNQLIVDDCVVLVACPPTVKELKRSGTWATIRMGRKANKQVVIIYPDGTLVEDCAGPLDEPVRD